MDRIEVFDLSDRYVVVELPAWMSAPGPALELHVAQREFSGATFAWWMDDEGKLLSLVEVAHA